MRSPGAEDTVLVRMRRASRPAPRSASALNLEPAHVWRLGLLALLLVAAAVAIGARVAFLQQAQQRDFLNRGCAHRASRFHRGEPGRDSRSPG